MLENCVRNVKLSTGRDWNIVYANFKLWNSSERKKGLNLIFLVIYKYRSEQYKTL